MPRNPLHSLQLHSAPPPHAHMPKFYMPPLTHIFFFPILHNFPLSHLRNNYFFQEFLTPYFPAGRKLCKQYFSYY